MPPGLNNILEIRGQFVSLDQGNRTKRNVIGLGAGRSDVQTYVQVYMETPRGYSLVEEFNTDVEADPRRIAKQLAQKIEDLFARQRWH